MYDNLIAYGIAKKYRETPLKDFKTVTPNTPLENLNLNWREGDLPENERTKHVHRLHPYLGKFIPQLVEVFLRKYTPKLIYDPFCGSGTTLVESNVLSINSIGTDISAFNVLLTKVKTASYDVSLAEKELKDILSKSFDLIKKATHDEKIKKSIDTNSEYLNKWFTPRARSELMAYLSLIKNYTYQDLLKVVLSRSARSARLVTHFDLDFPKTPQVGPYKCFKHSRICQPVNEAYKFLYRYTLDTIFRIKEFSLIRGKANAEVYHADSRQVVLPKNIDMVFTSPPYVGLIDYHEQHRYAYEFLGLKNNDTKEIGPAKNGQSEQARNDYIKGINDVILHTRDYMSKDAIMAIVVNDKFSLYKPENVGFKSIGRVERHVNRRTGRREGAFYESILIWKKS